MYKIYPSVLNAYQHYLNSEVDAEAFTNLTPDGYYRQSADEIAQARLDALLNTINRVPVTSEAMERGTAFNLLIDRLLANETIETDGKVCEIVSDGKRWSFDAETCRRTAQYLGGSLAQVYQEREIDTELGKVLLYGYADYVQRERIIDLKTTARYQFGKYEQGWQRYVYTYILAQDMRVESFTYLAVQMKTVDGVHCGSLYAEDYTTTAADTQILKAFLCRFIEFLEQHRSQITDLKILGE